MLWIRLFFAQFVGNLHNTFKGKDFPSHVILFDIYAKYSQLFVCFSSCNSILIDLCLYK